MIKARDPSINEVSESALSVISKLFHSGVYAASAVATSRKNSSSSEGAHEATPANVRKPTESATAEDADYISHDEESKDDYKPGGYHHISVGDVLKNRRYVIKRKLGWGHFSTVWLAWDSTIRSYVAVKVVKSAEHYTETALDEIKLLKKAASVMDVDGRVVRLTDSFSLIGANGKRMSWMHYVPSSQMLFLDIVMVFEVLGENLLTLIKRYNYRGIPMHIVKRIAYQVLQGLDILHRKAAIIHTDLKPENVLLELDSVALSALIGEDEIDINSVEEAQRNASGSMNAAKSTDSVL